MLLSFRFSEHFFKRFHLRAFPLDKTEVGKFQAGARLGYSELDNRIGDVRGSKEGTNQRKKNMNERENEKQCARKKSGRKRFVTLAAKSRCIEFAVFCLRFALKMFFNDCFPSIFAIYSTDVCSTRCNSKAPYCQCHKFHFQ